MNNFYIDKKLRVLYFYFLKYLSRINLNLGLKRILVFLIINRYFDGPERIRIFPQAIKCNHKCLMCWQRAISREELRKCLNEEKNSLTLEEYKKLFLVLPIKTKSVEVTGGGEPLLHPDIMQIFSEIKKHNLSGLLITNGALLDQSKAQLLLDISWDNIRISLHSAWRLSYRKLHGKDDFELVCKNILYLRKQIRLRRKKLHLSLLFVIQKENYQEIEVFSKLAEKLKVDEIEFDNLIPLVKKTLMNQKEIHKSVSLLEKVAKNCKITNNALEQILKYKTLYLWNNKSKNYVNLSSQRFVNKKCEVANESILITAAGDTYPCCLLMNKDKKLGNIRKETIHAMWNTAKYKNIRERLRKGIFFPECSKNCSYLLLSK
jgi:radical SAM protein with 4Fe4S-binding SPASM domain